MPDDPADNFLRLSEASNLPWLPKGRGGKNISISSLTRWSTVGLWGTVLRTKNIGQAVCTTEAWLRDFFDQLTARRPRAAARTERRAPATSSRRKAIANANAKLEALGM